MIANTFIFLLLLVCAIVFGICVVIMFILGEITGLGYTAINVLILVYLIPMAMIGLALLTPALWMLNKYLEARKQ